MKNEDGPREGDRFLVKDEFEAIIVTQWFAPFTGGYKRVLPVGLRFVVVADPTENATGIGAKPEPYQEWERVLVDVEDMDAEKYSGYYIVVPLDQLDRHCERFKD